MVRVTCIYSPIFNAFHALLQTHVFLQFYIEVNFWFYMFALEFRKFRSVKHIHMNQPDQIVHGYETLLRC